MAKFAMFAILLLATCPSAKGYDVELDDRPLVLPITEELGWFQHQVDEETMIFTIPFLR